MMAMQVRVRELERKRAEFSKKLGLAETRSQKLLQTHAANEEARSAR